MEFVIGFHHPGWMYTSMLLCLQANEKKEQILPLLHLYSGERGVYEIGRPKCKKKTKYNDFMSFSVSVTKHNTRAYTRGQLGTQSFPRCHHLSLGVHD